MKRLTIVLAASLLLCGCDTTPTTAEVTSALDEQGPQQVTLPAAEIFGSEWDEWVPCVARSRQSAWGIQK